jgi:hypothetical protein
MNSNSVLLKWDEWLVTGMTVRAKILLLIGATLFIRDTTCSIPRKDDVGIRTMDRYPHSRRGLR